MGALRPVMAFVAPSSMVLPGIGTIMVVPGMGTSMVRPDMVTSVVRTGMAILVWPGAATVGRHGRCRDR
jgi:hypothetical protein